MNFPSNIRPNFSVPPPPITPSGNHRNGVMGPRPTAAGQNQFQQFHNSQPIPQFNPNPPFAPFNFNQLLPTNRPNFPANSVYHPRGNNNFGPVSNNYNRHCHPSALRMPAHGQMFGTAGANVNNNTFPQANSHQQPQQQQQMFQQTQSQSQPGRGRKDFHRGRGGFLRGGSRPGGGHDRNFKQQSNSNRNQSQKTNENPKKKKERVDKRDLPENNAFFCDTCDRGFKTKDKYKEHTDGHIKCSHKDCPYTAAPKLVQLHLSMQHRGGLAKKIWSMESEEDVRKWREDRKRNYPTAINIQKKKELLDERLKRGEVLETKNFSKMKQGRNQDSGRGRGRQRGRFNRGHRNRRHGRFQQETQENEKGDEDEEDDDDEDGPPVCKKIHRTSCLDDEDTIGGDPRQKEDTVKPSDVRENAPLEETQDQGHISGLSLLTGYGSSSSDEDASDKEQESAKEADRLLQNSGNENDKVAKGDKNVLIQPVTRDNDHESSVSSSSQELRLSASPLQSPAPRSPDSAGNSPSTYRTDPFNLTGGDRGDSVKSDLPTNQRLSLLSENPLTTGDLVSSSFSNSPIIEGKNFDVLQSVEKETVSDSSVDDVDCVPQGHKQEHNNDFPIVDGEKFHETEESCDSVPFTTAKSEVSSNSTKKTNGKRERNSERCRSGTGREGRDKEVRRGELDIRRRRRQEHRPQAKSYTLLEKLLAPQIRQERNKILQCVCYIVKNKFFE